MVYFLLIIGFIFLVKGADIFVSGSSAIARYFNIPTFIIGLTIVAFGTSMPEAAISVTAALQGANGIAVGNALGSNLFNLLVVLGASAIIKECEVSAETLRFEYPVSIIAAGLLLVMSGVIRYVGMFGAGVSHEVEIGILSRVDGLILLLLFAVFMVATVRKTLNSREDFPDYDGSDDVGEAESSVSPAKAALYSILGLAGIILGGDLVVDSAVTIAEAFGIDEVLIGLTIVALGTSLPELVISVVAAFKGETDIAMGNVIGSNIFNLLLVLGLSATIHPIRITLFSVYDMIILIAASLIVLIPLARKQSLTRGWGVLLLLMYGAYLAYIIARTM